MITSASNPRVKRLVHLQKHAKARKEAGVFLAEGRKMCGEAPRDRVEEVYFSESYAEREGTGEWIGIRSEILSDSVFRTVSDTKTPQGILAVVKRSEQTLEQMLASEKTPLLVVLENLQDPGNLGTILRTAEGAGVTGVLLSGDTVDIYNPKTIRSTMGSLYRVPFCTVTDIRAAVSRLRDLGIACYAAALEESREYTEPDYRKPAAFLIGNEGNGLSRELIQAAGQTVRIPMEGQVESLNASMAAGLLMYEAARQRREKR
jgi:TrmH family RNA methyltransferase